MNSEKITVRVEGNPATEVTAGTPVGTLAIYAPKRDILPFIAALVNNDTCSMTYPLSVNSTVRFLTMADSNGWRIYRNSLCFILAKVVKELYPDLSFSIEHSLGTGLYCSLQSNGNTTNFVMSNEVVISIQKRMEEIVSRDIPILRHKISYMDAVKAFQNAGQYDKLNLLKFRNPPRIVIHECEGFFDFAHGPLAPSTGLLSKFSLVLYPPGFVIQFPTRESPHEVAPFEDQPHLFKILQEHKEWGKILGVTTVGRLNEIITAGEFDHIVQIAEALHEKKIAQIADQITENKNKIKCILIAGPSASGKTTFAKRLSIQLLVNGLRPLILSTDDYFVGEEKNPKDEQGNPDYEHIEAVDLELFNTDIMKLIRGKTIEKPSFNFITKKREYRGEKITMTDENVLIIEGIHGLNPRLTYLVPAENKFKIYVSALTQLNVDANNRISTTDNRLMRRMVRDYKFRGHSSLLTLQMWPSVRKGEKQWIFPFQKEANATFNSALDYELAVLKPLVEPLLMQIKPDVPAYAESRRLTEFLLNFLPAQTKAVPASSILREYIGGSSFHY